MDSFEGSGTVNAESHQEGRTRSYSWQDPNLTVAAAAKSSGIEVLQAISRGELPLAPLADTLGGFVGLDVGPGWTRFRFVPAEHHYNPIGSVHGGVAATLLDSALGCAVQTTLEAGVRFSTVDLKVTFVRGLTAATGEVSCHAEVVHVGTYIGTAQGRITDAAGTVYSHGTATCLILR